MKNLRGNKSRHPQSPGRDQRAFYCPYGRGKLEMRVQLDVPDYQESQGIQTIWEEGSTIAVQIDPEGAVLIQADRAGLISLARHLLTLAQEAVPGGSHIHYDQHNALENGSCEIVIEKR
jgi:hypothetical protein